MQVGDGLRLDTSSPTLRDPWLRALLVILTIIAALYLGQMVWALVSQVVDLVVLFAVAWLISFVLQPLVVGLSRPPGLPRTTAVLVVYACLLILLILVGVILLPALAAQTSLAVEQLPALADSANAVGGGIAHLLRERGIAVENYTDQLLRPVEQIGPALLSNALVIATGAASALAQVLLTIVISLYLMLDGDRIGAQLLRAVPFRYRDDFTYFLSSIYRAFGGFLRGQIIQSAVYGMGIALILMITGMPFVVLASVLGAVAIFVPFLGPFLGFIPPVLAALTVGGGKAVLVMILTLVLNLVVVNVIQPKVLSRQIGLHPILVLLAVLVGARLAGAWGALFGVPVAAVIVTMISFYQLTVAEREARVRELTQSADVDLPVQEPVDEIPVVPGQSASSAATRVAATQIPDH
ncbi:MAG: hypothetical protein QOF51_1510 [Chloroflexota bacterium]|jgi:predicted PurR-regulated permease PerM|nr:hypothetical protein [Chloroflexota bacterium]